MGNYRTNRRTRGTFKLRHPELSPKKLDAENWELDSYYDYGGDDTGYSWTLKSDPSISIEINPILTEDEQEDPETGETYFVEDARKEWIVYPAQNKRGIPNSPYIAETLEEAMREAEKLRRDYEK